MLGGHEEASLGNKGRVTVASIFCCQGRTLLYFIGRYLIASLIETRNVGRAHETALEVVLSRLTRFAR